METDQQRLHRSLIVLNGIDADTVRLEVPGWSPDRVISRPAANIALPDGAKSGDYMLGYVNIGAITEDQLRFEKIDEILPQPDITDGLGID